MQWAFKEASGLAIGLFFTVHPRYVISSAIHYDQRSRAKIARATGNFKLMKQSCFNLLFIYIYLEGLNVTICPSRDLIRLHTAKKWGGSSHIH
jgi:hypothetical protein